MKQRLIKILYIFLGFLFMAIGALGAILPVLPTTPFLLLASYFFARGSERFNKWFLATRLYKNYLQDFIQDRSMELKTKIKILIPASTMLLIAAYLVEIIYFRVFVGFLILYKYYYFTFKIKTIRRDIEGSRYCGRTDKGQKSPEYR